MIRARARVSGSGSGFRRPKQHTSRVPVVCQCVATSRGAWRRWRATGEQAAPRDRSARRSNLVGLGSGSAPGSGLEPRFEPSSPSNPNSHRWVGDFDDGKVMSYGELKPKSTETILDHLCSHKIDKDVKTYHQLNAYADMFKVLIDKGVLTEDDPGVSDFLEQREIIDRARKNNELYKKARTESKDEYYLSKEQEDEKKNAQLAGGLNTVTGRY